MTEPCTAVCGSFCARCADPFTPYRSWQRFCSRRCQQAAAGRLRLAALERPRIVVPSRKQRIAAAAAALRGAS